MTLLTHWHKRVPADMVGDYIAKGWRVHEREGATVVLVWQHKGAPE
jgi:hypothetical protein